MEHGPQPQPEQRRDESTTSADGAELVADVAIEGGAGLLDLAGDAAGTIAEGAGTVLETVGEAVVAVVEGIVSSIDF
jgi:hypothetical protein